MRDSTLNAPSFYGLSASKASSTSLAALPRQPMNCDGSSAAGNLS